MGGMDGWNFLRLFIPYGDGWMDGWVDGWTGWAGWAGWIDGIFCSALFILSEHFSAHFFSQRRKKKWAESAEKVRCQRTFSVLSEQKKVRCQRRKKCAESALFFFRKSALRAQKKCAVNALFCAVRAKKKCAVSALFSFQKKCAESALFCVSEPKKVR